MIRVAIANDTVTALSALRWAIATNPAYELIWSAQDGRQAVELCARDTPDLILMDLRMPGLDGAAATRQIMANSPCAILIVTGSVRNNTSKIFEAMGYGALDVVRTPILGSSTTPKSVSEAAAPLFAKMATVTAFIGKSIRREKSSSPWRKSPAKGTSLPPLIVIGASTGGPKAIAHILKAIPAACPAAIVIVQHINQQFAPGLANWLNEQSPLTVKLAEAGEHICAGRVYVAAGGQHLVMSSDRTLHYLQNDTAPGHNRTPYRPSVDIFFKSVAQHWPHQGQAALLTGMGRDGAIGLKSLRAAAWITIAESKESCVVYGMPRAAVENDAASQILPINEISNTLLKGLSH